jgi:hypothetical protein
MFGGRIERSTMMDEMLRIDAMVRMAAEACAEAETLAKSTDKRVARTVDLIATNQELFLQAVNCSHSRALI